MRVARVEGKGKTGRFFTLKSCTRDNAGPPSGRGDRPACVCLVYAARGEPCTNGWPVTAVSVRLPLLEKRSSSPGEGQGRGAEQMWKKPTSGCLMEYSATVPSYKWKGRGRKTRPAVRVSLFCFSFFPLHPSSLPSVSLSSLSVCLIVCLSVCLSG